MDFPLDHRDTNQIRLFSVSSFFQCSSWNVTSENCQESLMSLQPGYQGLCTSASTTSAIDFPEGTMAGQSMALGSRFFWWFLWHWRVEFLKVNKFLPNPRIQCLPFISVFCLKCYKCENSQESLLSLQPGYQGLCTSASTTSAIDCPDGTLACINETTSHVHKTSSGQEIKLEWSQMGCASQDQAGFFKIGTCRNEIKGSSQGIECMCDTDFCNGPNKGTFFSDQITHIFPNP